MATATTTEPMREVARYPYYDSDGTHLYDQVRFEPKDFRPQMADGSWGLTCQRVLYRLPQIIGPIEDEKFIWIVEGEKDADLLAAFDFPVTTAGPASAWESCDTTPLLRAHGVVILPDRDDAGEELVKRIGYTLFGSIRWIHVMRLESETQPTPKGFDVSDWAGENPAEHDVHLLHSMRSAMAPLWKPPPRPRRATRRGRTYRRTKRTPGLPYDVGDLTFTMGGRLSHGNTAVVYCPAHQDEGSANPGLSLTGIDIDQTLAFCHSGCDFRSIAEAVRDMMEDD